LKSTTRSFIHQIEQEFIIDAMKISIVIVVKDEPEIAQTLKLIDTQFDETGMECIVVDASNGRLRDIAQLNPQVRWRDFKSRIPERKITIAEQRNFGVRASSGEVIVFCDAGGSPEPGWLKALTTPLLIKEHVIVGGPVRATNPDSAETWTNLQSDGEEIQYPTTANLALTREAFDLVDGFNEDLEYGSDADLVLRLKDQGITQICVASAVMGLDGGTKRRERKRAWRYGKALADLLYLHPKRRSAKFRSNPEIWIYPVLTLVAILALLPSGFSELIAILFFAGNLGILIKNRGSRHPFAVLANHYIYGWGFTYQLFRKKIPTFKLAEVLIYPADDIRFLEELLKGFKDIDEREARVALFPKLSLSNTLNILLLPFLSPLLRMRGVRILHIHWLYRFNLIWARGDFLGRLVENWFKFWIYSMKLVGIKVIWTAHNVLPHSQIFRDDFSIRKFLVQKCSSVIALSNIAADELQKIFTAQRIEVIPEGPLLHPTTFSKADFRNRLGVPEENILLVSLGNLSSYKGIADLLSASHNLNPRLSIRIAGWCSKSEEHELESLCEEVRASGTDIQVIFGKLTKNEFGGYLHSADLYVAPFRKVTNSGSINAALTAGLPVVIPDLPSLNWVPRDAAVIYQPDSNGIELVNALHSLPSLPKSKIHSMKLSAAGYMLENSWQLVARQHHLIYIEILNR